jgi:DNA-binding Lrp family transcriptional regulator
LQAYVLIQTEANRAPIAETIRRLPGVMSAEDLTGPYDAIALARADSSHSLSDQVIGAIERIPGVIRALSAPLIRSLAEMRPVEAGAA